MGLFRSLFSGLSKAAKSAPKPKRPFAHFPKRPNPLSNRSLGNTSRYKRF